MNDTRAKDLLKHITKDVDYGVGMMKRIGLIESLDVCTQLIPSCIKKAEDAGNENDCGYFKKMQELYRPVIIDKLKQASKLWVVYCDQTGYPYMIDDDIIILYDFAHKDNIVKPLEEAGYEISTLDIDGSGLMNEIGHMYRNGCKSIRFMNGKYEPIVIEREEFYSYEQFFKDDYITNPGLQNSCIRFTQEFKSNGVSEKKEEVCKKLEDEMIKNLRFAEFMVPCVRTEHDDLIELSHPPIDISKTEDEQIIVLPAFTDAFELEKCYTGHPETMLYKFIDLWSSVEEFGVSGFVINFLGEAYYVDKYIAKVVNG